MIERKITYNANDNSLQYETIIIANTIDELGRELLNLWISFRSIKRIECITQKYLFKN